ncbi:MAG: hypothetical protein EOM48_13345 [Bacilli bacterium]|nr:hypothetical protein [Bacilli bacterium]
MSRKQSELHPSWDTQNVSKVCDEMEAKRIIDEINKGNLHYAHRGVEDVVLALVSRVAYLERMIDVLASRGM